MLWTQNQHQRTQVKKSPFSIEPRKQFFLLCIHGIILLLAYAHTKAVLCYTSIVENCFHGINCTEHITSGVLTSEFLSAIKLNRYVQCTRTMTTLIGQLCHIMITWHCIILGMWLFSTHVDCLVDIQVDIDTKEKMSILLQVLDLSINYSVSGIKAWSTDTSILIPYLNTLITAQKYI